MNNKLASNVDTLFGVVVALNAWVIADLNMTYLYKQIEVIFSKEEMESNHVITLCHDNFKICLLTV